MNDDKSRPEADQREPEAEESSETAEARARGRLGRKIGEGLLSGLLESGAAIRRGQDRVTGVAQDTKEEVLRIVGAEVRGFLDKMDIVDMMQQVVSGLVIDVNAQIRIRRDDEGKVSTSVEKQDVRLDREDEKKEDDGDD